MDKNEKLEWVKRELEFGDHVGVRTNGFLFWGEYFRRLGSNIFLQLDSGERIMMNLEDVKDINDQWPQ